MAREVSRSLNGQLLINMATSILVFILGLAVNFFLTPYVVEQLGADSYGFLGLSNTIIGYTGLLTIAVGSMAGRFITIKVHEGKYEEANRYLSSLFYVNLGFSLLFMVCFCGFSYYMPNLIDVPFKILNDVRILFLLLGFNSCLGLILGIIGIGVFIKNRLDYGNIRGVIGQLINSTLIILLFTFLKPRLWYYGIAGVVMELYAIATNYYFFKNLTPYLKISFEYFDLKYIKELIESGAWNVVSKLSEMLNKGFNLLIANVFISATCMGLLSIAQTIPMLILGFFGTICANFVPTLTKFYALENMSEMKNEFFKALRLTSLFSCIPLSAFFVYGDIFYKLWLPNENAQTLYILSCLGSFGLIFGLPQEPLWNIFTITNTVKKSSLNLLLTSAIVFALVMCSMLVFQDNLMRLYCVAGISSLIGTIRVLTFLPMYGAKVLGFNKTTFYPAIIKNAINVTLIMIVSFSYKRFFMEETWGALVVGAFVTSIIGLVISSFTILKITDIKLLLNKIIYKINIYTLR